MSAGGSVASLNFRLRMSHAGLSVWHKGVHKNYACIIRLRCAANVLPLPYSTYQNKATKCFTAFLKQLNIHLHGTISRERNLWALYSWSSLSANLFSNYATPLLCALAFGYHHNPTALPPYQGCVTTILYS